MTWAEVVTCARADVHLCVRSAERRRITRYGSADRRAQLDHPPALAITTPWVQYLRWNTGIRDR